MVPFTSEAQRTLSPLEEFMRDYIETTGGVWDEIEPQVYDVLLPLEGAPSRPEKGQSILRVTFDPEALPEHPGAQLASFGTPLIDQLLADAMRRGRYAQLYFVGLNLTPHDLLPRVRRSLTLPANLQLRLERVRALHFGQAVFWFQAAFISDQKEDETLPVALDLHYGRQVRHLEKLLDFSRLTEHPALPLPEVERRSVASAYPLVREEVIRSLAPLANARDRELRERLQRQASRMSRYYADLRRELDEQEGRLRGGEDSRARLAARREAIDREERLRVAELHQKNTLRVHLRLLQLLLIQQPKLLLRCLLTPPERAPGRLDLVWDPLLDALEPAPCPSCRRPTFAFGLTRDARVVCSDCAKNAIP